MELPKVGAFSPCSVYWDDSQKKYVNSTTDQVYNCCQKRCNEYNNACLKVCKKDYPKSSVNYYNDITENQQECKESCDILTDVCNRVCESGRFDFTNRYFDKCLESSKCIQNDSISEECLTINKEKIITCCKDSCEKEKLPNVDCSNHCDTSYNIHLIRSKNIPSIQNIQMLKQSIVQNNNYSVTIYFFLLMLILLYTVLCFINLKSNNKR